jgi:hypothetical protein
MSRKFLTKPTVIDWLQWFEFPERIDKPDMPQVTLLLIKEYEDEIKLLGRKLAYAIQWAGNGTNGDVSKENLLVQLDHIEAGR